MDMPFEGLVSRATGSLVELGFVPLDEGGGERHGSWEWAWVKQRGGKGHCYASLGALEFPERIYRMQVWAGADDGLHFGRYLVTEFYPIREPVVEDTEQAILGGLKRAAEQASALPDASLTDTYVAWV